jgi:hypothetical protein
VVLYRARFPSVAPSCVVKAVVTKLEPRKARELIPFGRVQLSTTWTAVPGNFIAEGRYVAQKKK